jgi:hypothetical protein
MTALPGVLGHALGRHVECAGSCGRPANTDECAGAACTP